MEFFVVLIVAAIILIIVIGKRNPDSLKNSLGANPSHFKSDSSKDVTIEITMDVEYEGPDVPEVEVTDEEIETRVKQYAFIFEDERPKQLKGTEAWFKERNHNKFLKTEPERALDWILPFVPQSIASLDRLRPIVEQGPSGHLLMKELRALIRERRKSKEPYGDLLEAMYKTAVLCDFTETLTFEGRQPHSMYEYVALEDMQRAPIDFSEIGFEYLKSPLKTDRKWFVESFGDPIQHMPAEENFSEIRELAISRSCWKRFSKHNSLRRPANELKDEMYEWLREEVAHSIRWEKIAAAEFQQRKATPPTRKRTSVKKSIEATRVPFVVADLETTGLSANQHEITEVAAILVNPDGTATSEFSSLVKTVNPIPTRITELTGIDDNLVRAEGKHLKPVMEEFLSQTAGRPIFFHHAPFDQGFLNAACEAHGLRLDNEIYDTLPIARKAWPSLGQYKLGTLAEFLELNQPNHRALQDARAALAVLLASRAILK